ncbi:hypothetical protein Tco_0668048 [Tanacetum coccineum]
MEHTFDQQSTDQQPPTPRQEATTSQLMTRIGDLEKQLKETKQTFGKAILILVERIKTLEVALKRKTKRVLLSDSEEEETEAQGRKTRDLDPLLAIVLQRLYRSKTKDLQVVSEPEPSVSVRTNFSKLIFDSMVANLKSKTKFLMYPRILQMILDIQTENKHLYLAVTLTKKIFGNMKRGFKGVPRPLLPVILSIVAPSVGQEAPSVTQHQPSSSVVPPTPPTTQPIPSEAITISPLSQPAPPTPIAETTTASPLPSPSPAHEPMEHTFEQPSSDQQPPSPRQEATTSQLMTRIDNLEKQLKETKQTFGKAILTLVERVKTLEVALKRKTKRVLLSDSEEEETEAQGRKTNDLDPLVSLVQELVTPSKIVNASGEEQVEDIGPTTLEAAAILTKVKKIKSVDKGKRYKRRKSLKEFAGTGLDFEEVKSAFEKVNTGGIKISYCIEEINTGSLDLNTGIDPVTTDSIRVLVPSPDREKEEVAKQVHLDSLLAQRLAEEQELTEEQKKRKAQVQFEAQSYTEEDWDTIRAKLEANA